MKSAIPQTEPSLPTQLRKVVFGGSLIAGTPLTSLVFAALLLVSVVELRAADGSNSLANPAKAEVPKHQGRTEHARRIAFPYPPKMPDSRVETYKTVGNTKLNLYILAPANPTNAPAIIFFFGGGWAGGSPQQFEDQCRNRRDLGGLHRVRKRARWRR